MRARHPDLPFPEITKRLGAEWTQLAPNDKQVGDFSHGSAVVLVLNGCTCPQRYLDEAEREKVQYAQELKEYQQTEAFQISSAKIHDKKIKKGDGAADLPFPWKRLSPHRAYSTPAAPHAPFLSYRRPSGRLRWPRILFGEGARPGSGWVLLRRFSGPDG